MPHGIVRETEGATKNVVSHDIFYLKPVELDAVYAKASNVVLHDIPRSPVVLHGIYRRRLRKSINTCADETKRENAVYVFLCILD